MRKRGNACGHQGENERQRKQKGEQGHIKRVTRKFLVVVVQSNGKEMYQKVCCRWKVVFLLIRPTDFLGCFRCRRRLALHDFIFYLGKLDIRSTYHFNRNFGENFRQMVLVFFWHRKRERDWDVPFENTGKFFVFISTWSLALVIQTNGTENFGRFGKNGKGNTSKGITFFPENFHQDELFHLNSPRNYPGFHTNGKRSRLTRASFFNSSG